MQMSNSIEIFSDFSFLNIEFFLKHIKKEKKIE